jgi:hypothetical protein
MAKPKQKVVKTPKKHSPKYSKIAATCSKELEAKKKALASAEKTLAKAQRTHSELLSEVARLDMLDRSLKALINGTEPPQNVRYVYTYPQWVWYPYNGYGWNWNGNCSLTLGATTSGSMTQIGNNTCVYNTTDPLNLNVSSGAVLTSTGATPTWQTANAFTTPSTTPSTTSNVSLTNFSVPTSSLCSAGGDGMLGYTSSGLDSAVLTTTNSSGQYTLMPSNQTSSDFTVDLSTGAEDPTLMLEAESMQKELQQKFPKRYAEYKAEEKIEAAKAKLGDALLDCEENQ